MSCSDVIDLVNRNIFNGIKIGIIEEINPDKKDSNVVFTAKISIKGNNIIEFKKKYVMLNSNDDFNSFHSIMSDKFKKDFIENYFTKGILSEK